MPTRQKVKRAAPGGEGFVLDHFSREAVEFYLSKYDTAFARSGVPFPNTFFNDSYEVYGADWTDSLLVEFERRRGYRLQDHYAELLDEQEQVKIDYRQTLAELLMENFAEVWVNWCHSHGVQVRNQSHGSLAANYLAEMDRRGIVWRNFKDANIANLKGGKVSYYGNWDVMPCGLNSVSLRLIQPNR